MPTGYTYVIDDGGDFRAYFDKCKGAFVRNDGEVKRPEEEPYYRESVLKAENALVELEQADAQTAYNSWFAETTKRNAKQLQRNKALREKYAQIRMQVADWSPPSDKHVEFKKFMLSQLEVGIAYDMSGFYQPPQPQDPNAWMAVQIEEAQQSLVWEQDALQKHLANVKAGQEWFDALVGAAP